MCIAVAKGLSLTINSPDVVTPGPLISDSSSLSLAPGAIAGITIALVVLVVILIVAIVMAIAMVIRRLQKKKKSELPSHSGLFTALISVCESFLLSLQI